MHTYSAQKAITRRACCKTIRCNAQNVRCPLIMLVVVAVLGVLVVCAFVVVVVLCAA